MLNMRETRIVEFKETITNTFLKTVSAFSNYDGGTILFGVDDDGNVKGLPDVKQACLDIENKINDSISPQPNYMLELQNNDQTIKLTVKSGLQKPYLYKSKAYKRNDTATIEVDTLEFSRLVLEGKNISFEELQCKDQELSFDFLQHKLKENIQIESFNQDTLKTLNLYDNANGFNNAAGLLADKNHFSGIDLVKFGENISIIQKRVTFENVSVLDVYEKTLAVFSASPALMKMCAERNVGLCFLSANGQFQGRVSGPTKGNVLLRRTQYRIADDANKSLEISRLFIAGKIANSRTVIDRFKRDHISSDKQLSLFLSVSEKLKRSKNQALVAESSDTLRGIEGEAATTYFSVFNQMIISQCEDFPFNGRNRRPPKDKVNALLSFVYTLLNHEVQSALETVGLDPFYYDI